MLVYLIGEKDRIFLCTSDKIYVLVLQWSMMTLLSFYLSSYCHAVSSSIFCHSCALSSCVIIANTVVFFGWWSSVRSSFIHFVPSFPCLVFLMFSLCRSCFFRVYLFLVVVSFVFVFLFARLSNMS